MYVYIKMDYLYINKMYNYGNDALEIIEIGEEDDILSRHTIGHNSDNYILAQQDRLQVKFSVVKIEGLYYVSINNEYVLDYKKFMMFESIRYTGKDTVMIQYIYIPCIIIKGCSIALVNKMISVLQNDIKQKIGLVYNIRYYMKSLLV